MARAGRTLLVVDDNEANRDILSRRLQRQGFTVLEAESGQRALDVVEQQAIKAAHGLGDSLFAALASK